ncbi:NAD(P)H-binding protein [Labilithrix luteola]|nr:NAD(P)H-binding protein [Labilithrix luteola]
MILVTGATGTIGRLLLAELRGKAEVRAMTRDPEKARAALGALGETIELVRGDYDDARTLTSALEGASSLFLLAAPGPTVSDHDRAMMNAVAAAGAKRSLTKVVKLSALGADASPLLRAGAWHQPGERAVRESGLAWTILRPGGFASNALGWAASLRSGTEIEVATSDGRHGVIDPRDVAAVAARALLSNELDGRGFTLTGPEAISTPDQLAILGEALGRPVVMKLVTPDHAADKMASFGVPAPFVEAVREGHGFVRSGRAAELTGSVAEILGRPARSFRTWVNDHLAAFG